MDPALVASTVLLVASFLAVALMAYFALRPEDRRPKCPRCDKTLAPDAARCPQCGLAIERPTVRDGQVGRP